MRRYAAFFASVSLVAAVFGIGITPAAAAPTSVSEMLSSLSVTSETLWPAYGRRDFNHWIDANNNGCDTRAEVLISESRKKVTKKGKCTIVSGEWLSTYDNSIIKIASKVDVDHLVPLAEAWRSGAFAWSASVRQSYANDLGVSYSLLAVAASTKRSKSDKDPAKWLPSNSEIVCNYIGSWIAVKYRWSLSVDDAEKAVLLNNLNSCGSAAEVAVPHVKVKQSVPEISKPSSSPTPTLVSSSKLFSIFASGPKEAEAGSTIQVTVSAVDINGKPVNGVPVSYKDLSDNSFGEGPVTDSNGKSVVTLTINPKSTIIEAYIFKSGDTTGSYVVLITEKPKTAVPGPSPTPTVAPTTPAPRLDPRYATCTEAKGSGYGPYYRSTDPEYYWYIDRDKDGIVCE